MKKYIIFDMDGVIIDSEMEHALANVQAFHEIGIDETIEYFLGFVGNSLPDMIGTIRSQYDIALSDRELVDHLHRVTNARLEANGYKEVPGTMDLIRELKRSGCHLAIASSSSPAQIHGVLSHFHIDDCFEGISSGTEVPHSKPEPDVFLQAARLLQADPSECLVIEDSTVGIQAACAAHMDSIGFVNPVSGNQDLSKATYVVHHMSDCMDFIKCS